ncbi:MAG: sulfatase [Opitutaceae bacterium]|nr:sulfatase [Opitutaceae bacterium]
MTPLLLFGGAGAFAAIPPARPNVLFIAIDDLNVDLGTFGHAIVRTPNVERLAARGVKFDRAYCQFPLCNPSRQSFLSGLRPETSGVVAQGLSVRQQRPDYVYLPGWFRAQGYTVSGVGKIFHANDPVSWETYKNGNSTSPQENAALDRRAAVRSRGEHGPEWTPIDDPDETMGDGIVARTAVGYLREAAAAGRPFFVAAGFRKPHLPWTAPRRFFEQYPRAAIPKRSEPAMSGIPKIALETDLTGKIPPGQEWQGEAAYYACVSFIDAQIGLLLDAMDELRLWERTVVVLLGDHGFHLGDHGLWGKLTNFERSARVPLIIAAPAIRHGGSTTRAIVELIDLYPTLAELAGAAPPAGLEGRSLVPILRDPGLASNRPAYTSTIHRGVLGRSVRTERWRYTEWVGGGDTELYDHDADPGEYRNLAADPARAADVTALKRLLEKNPRLAGPVPADAQAERRNRKK